MSFITQLLHFIKSFGVLDALVLNLYSMVNCSFQGVQYIVNSHDGTDKSTNNIEESVITKSTGQQEEDNMAVKDAALYKVLNSKKKITKQEAGYREQDEVKTSNNNSNKACIKCKFNLPDEEIVIF